MMQRETTGKTEKEDGIARRTPNARRTAFCHYLTERRRTTVRFLGQQSEMMIDDTWPHAGEMRSLWKGMTEFWTNDMPQNDTWEANRHHSHILPLFRSHLTRETAAVFSVPQNTTTSTGHGFRDSHLPAVPHTENAEEEGRRVVLVLPKPYSVYSTHHDDSSCATETQPWATGTGKGNTCQLCGAIINDKDEITGSSKSVQWKLVSNKENRRSSQKVEGRTELDLVLDDVDEAKRSLEEAHLEVQAAQNKVTEAAFR